MPGRAFSSRDRARYWNLPPDPSLIQPAPPGEYRMRSTGEVITNPDFITTWMSVKN